MVSSTSRRGAIGLLSAAVALSGLVLGPAQADSGQLSLDRAGTLVGWYATGSQTAQKDGTVPAAYASTAFTQVAAASGTTLAVTAAGKLVGWGTNQEGVWDSTNFPSGLDGHIAQVDATASLGLALKDDGTVVSWPRNSPTQAAKIPATLTGVGAISAFDANNAYALKKDGSVVAWGDNSYGQTDVPEELRLPGSTLQVEAGSEWAAAVTSDHRIVAWGRDSPDENNLDVPSELTGPDAGVAKVVIDGRTALALLQDGSVRAWGAATAAGQPNDPPSAWLREPPAALQGKDVTDISMGLALTDAGDLVAWNLTDQNGAATFAVPPSSLDGRPISSIVRGGDTAWAIVSSVSSVSVPTISGTVTSGQTLTGTPGTFTGGGTVTNQWYASGSPVAGATGTSLALTDALVGKTITFRSTASKGSETASSESVATAAVTANQTASTVKATSTAGTYGASAPKLSVTVSPTSATGTVSAFRGTTKIAGGTLKSGKATLTPTSRTSVPVGATTVTLKYAGDSQTAPSQGTVKVTVKKGKATITAKPVTKTIKVKKTKAKLSVTVKATGLTPAGTVTAYLGRTKVGSGKLAKGKVTVTLKAFKKAGKNKVTLKYSGSSTVGSAGKTLTLTVKK